MALSDRWSIDLGRASGGNLPPGTTGKEYCQHVWRAARTWLFFGPSVKGNHPQMAKLFRLVKYFDLPRFLEVLGVFFWGGVFGSFSVTGTGEMEDVASLATINWLVAQIWDFLGMGGCSYHFFQNYILVWKSGMTKTHSDTCLAFSSCWGNPRMKHMGGQMGLNVYIYIYVYFLTYEICFGSWYDYLEWKNRVI